LINPKVYILILNYNGWADTIECLESVLRNDYPNYQVIVMDNDSPNNSMGYIKAWAEGKLDVWVKREHPLRHLSFPPVKKSIPYVFYKRKEAEKGGKSELATQIKNSINIKHPLIIIQTGDNLGFAGGNNVGMRYALAKNDFQYIWLLNNDTVIKMNALKHLVEKAESYKKEGQKIGTIGSKLLYYDNPKIINGVGGKHNKWFAVSKQIGVLEEDKCQYDTKYIKMDYVIGASLFVSNKFIEDIGLMCEDYFLYCEEMDWAERGRRKDWNLGYCWQSNVYHKEGRTTGSSNIGKEKSDLADYYLGNRIVFTKKFFPQCLWSVYLGFIVTFFNRIKRRQWKRLNLILSILKK